MDLDFSKLNSLGFIEFEDIEEAPEMAPETTKTEPEREAPTLDMKALEMASTAPEGDRLAYMKLTREQEDRARVQEAYKDYQTNIRKAGELRTQILKGASSGEDPVALFLKACMCISSMTGEKLFLEQIEKDLTVIYGEALLEPVPLERELEKVRARITRLQKALQRDRKPEDRYRVEKAIESHRRKAGELEGLLREAEVYRQTV